MQRLKLGVAMLLAAFVFAACATHNTVSEGDDGRLMLKGHDAIPYFI